MSMRGNVVTVKNGTVRILGHGWGACGGAILDILACGQRGLDDLGDNWTETNAIYDEIFGEGGAFIDFDNCKIICYSDHEPMGETAWYDQPPDVTLRKIEAAWTGWSIERERWLDFAKAVEALMPDAVRWDD